MAANGEKLKQARLKQGKSIQDFSIQTRISVQYLEAMEADNLEAIPGEFFRRSFLKQYASALGVNPDEVQPERPLEFRALGGSGAEPLAQVRYHEPPDLPPLPSMGQSRGLPWRQVFLSIGLLVGVLAVCAVAYTLWEDSQANREQREEASVQAPPPPVLSPETPAASTDSLATGSALDSTAANAADGATDPASGSAVVPPVGQSADGAATPLLSST
ncbi:MAG: helix-turn-helix domain-containing protein, partial [Bryobacterales bacterium]|nr:helix-turn-helix domain-containing protein [Bryobacterales bacterium]